MRRSFWAIPLLAIQASSALAAPALATAIFAGGCFWSNEHDLDAIPGVVRTVSGFAGGKVAHPSYGQVTTGTTGHLEAVRVTYDPRRISYAELSRRFLRTIDPTDNGGQFCDRGPQYRTALFPANPSERIAAIAAIRGAEQQLHRRVATEIRTTAAFWPAEAYHQDYADKNPLHYGIYRRGCGRDARVRQVWGA